MASICPPSTEEDVFEEEEVWMEDEEALNFTQNGKKMVMAYDDGQGELTAQAEEYHEVDVEEYDETGQDGSYRSNLPDLLSKRIQLDNGSTMTMCFSKKGIHQLAVDGYLYNLSHSDGPNSTWVCINPECTAHIMSINDMSTLSRDNDLHVDMCEPDEDQIRLRIAIYDLRLVAEFTDVDLELLYHNYATSFAQENPHITELFPSFGALHRSLVVHRRHKTYRRHFDSQEGENGEKMMEDIDEDDESLMMSVMGGEEVVEESYSERVPIEGELAINREMQLNPYGRTRAFPATFCMECEIEMTTSPRIYSPQQALGDHVSRMHQPIKIHTFVFEPPAFEMWLREVQRCPALRFRRFSLIGEDMYYLCSCDMRLPRNKFTKKCHCTAYIKIADYRTVSARQAHLVSIEYSFEHFAHDVEVEGTKPPEQMIAELRPEDFLYDMERRKQATANLMRSQIDMNNRRRAFANSMAIRSNLSSFGVRMAEDVFSMSRCDARTAATRNVAIAPRHPSVRLSVRPCGSKPLDPSGTITRRANFKDQSVYDSVRQFEQLSQIVVRRLQSVKSLKVADQYTEIMKRMVNRIVTDMECTPEGSATAIWNGNGVNAPRNCVNPGMKRTKEEREEEEEEEDVSKRKRASNEEEEGREVEKEGEGEGDVEVEKIGEEEAGEKEKMNSPGVIEEEKKEIRRRGRCQLPVKNTLMATARIVEKEQEKSVDGGKEEGTPMITRGRIPASLVKEDTQKIIPSIPARSKSSRIQARKEKNEGESEEKKSQ